MPMETFVKLMPILYSTRRTLNSSIAASNASQCIMHDIDCALHCLKELQLTIKSSIETTLCFKKKFTPRTFMITV